MRKQDLQQVAPYLYEIAASFREDMRVPARFYANAALLEAALSDHSIEQLVNTATLPGVVGYALAMPDVHEGYGFPIGGVVATALPDGAISPGGVGYDINCGVRLLTSALTVEELRPHMERLMSALFGQVPTGVGASGSLRLSERDLRALLQEGSRWALRRGYATPQDCAHTEDGGLMESADADAVSARSLERGREQVGTLGAGNHFLEIDQVVEIYDPAAARAYGLELGRVCIWIHCGSRGLGHQVCTEAVAAMQRVVAKRQLHLPDRELAYASFDSPEGRQYLAAMSCAANYAWANRQVITHLVRQSFEQALAGRVADTSLQVMYDVCHNIAKVERHRIAGKERTLCVHRKGATRAFGPGEPQVPEDYRAIGQPVLVPGNMEVGAYILAGTQAAMSATFGSACHGAGRVMSRAQARRSVRGERLREHLERQEITVRAGSLSGLAEEAPDAYKDLDSVVQVVHDAGLARKVARTRPLGVIKG